MEEIYAAWIAYEPCLLDYVEFKTMTEPVWLLGRQYKIQEGENFEKLNEDIRSRLWFTYRKQFLPIGETSFTSDSGWGCMHRCGQMIMAQAMILRHFGRDWKWKPDCCGEMYKKILRKFEDKAENPYSIHKIALKGNILEKQVGQWFGPNTIVQVLKRLAEEDLENDISVHVAMDNMVIKSEIKKLFKRGKSKSTTSNLHNADFPTVSSSTFSDINDQGSKEGPSEKNHPVLLTIPLRLGLSEITPVYFDKLKGVFTLKQSVGMVGGRTNHASYFIGYVGNELIYLDPHTTQMHSSEGPMDDFTYHCQQPSRMSFSQLDPSIAICFYLENEADFDQWCQKAQEVLLEPERDAIFEILEEKPPMLPFADIETDEDFISGAAFNDKDRIYTSDDEFELLM